MGPIILKSFINKIQKDVKYIIFIDNCLHIMYKIIKSLKYKFTLNKVFIGKIDRRFYRFDCSGLLDPIHTQSNRLIFLLKNNMLYQLKSTNQAVCCKLERIIYGY